MMKTEFNLSEKIFDGEIRPDIIMPDFILEKDVKKFIELLKEEIRYDEDCGAEYVELNKIIDKLAGDKLTGAEE